MKNTIYFVLIMALSILTFAHGEDKFGPHKGYIRMPGAFHTEVVPVGKNEIKVFLLDIEWKNPSVARSAVKVSIISEKTTEATCVAKDSYFLCSFPKQINLKKKAELQVLANREGQIGAVAKYNLPLKLEKDSGMPPMPAKQEQKMDHSGHH